MKKITLALLVTLIVVIVYKVYVFGRDMYKFNSQYGWYWRA